MADLLSPKITLANPDRKICSSKKDIRIGQQIPSSILNDPKLQMAIDMLPKNYDFEIHKTIWKIKYNQYHQVALQFPEGLLMFANIIADIIESFTDAEVIIMGDVTYGACCVDDFTARALNAQLLIHYGHSCLVPISMTPDIQMLYIFVDIKIDSLHFVETVKFNFEPGMTIAFVSTIQFITTLHAVSRELKEKYNVILPQSRPLSPGEILGCTSPKLPEDTQAIIYLGDGRFHLESIMISNPNINAYRYDPYTKILSHEFYDFDQMHTERKRQIQMASTAKVIGLIQGTLGRQGSVKVLENLSTMIEASGKESMIILASEIFSDKLKLFDGVDAWVQVACPRLSIDWGATFREPLLTPYELAVALSRTKYEEVYPMDYYANNSLGEWTVNHESNRTKVALKK